MLVYFVWIITILSMLLLIIMLLITLTQINLYINFTGIDNNIYITYLGIIKYSLYQNKIKKDGSYFKHKIKKLKKQNKKDCQSKKIKIKQSNVLNHLFKNNHRKDTGRNKIESLKLIINLIKKNNNLIAIMKAFIAHTTVNLNVKYNFFYSEPHITAFFYGIINSLKFNLDFLLCKYFKRNHSEVLIIPDFEERKNNIDIRIELSIKLLDICILALKMIPIIANYKKMKIKTEKAV